MIIFIVRGKMKYESPFNQEKDHHITLIIRTLCIFIQCSYCNIRPGQLKLLQIQICKGSSSLKPHTNAALKLFLISDPQTSKWGALNSLPPVPVYLQCRICGHLFSYADTVPFGQSERTPKGALCHFYKRYHTNISYLGILAFYSSALFFLMRNASYHELIACLSTITQFFSISIQTLPYVNRF